MYITNLSISEEFQLTGKLSEHSVDFINDRHAELYNVIDNANSNIENVNDSIVDFYYRAIDIISEIETSLYGDLIYGRSTVTAEEIGKVIEDVMNNLKKLKLNVKHLKAATVNTVDVDLNETKRVIGVTI